MRVLTSKLKKYYFKLQNAQGLKRLNFNLSLLLLLAGLLAACSGTYYKAMEGLGIEKRDILVDRVEDARDAQDDASSPAVSSPTRVTTKALRADAPLAGSRYQNPTSR